MRFSKVRTSRSRSPRRATSITSRIKRTNRLTVNVNPVTDKELAARDDVFKFKGEKLSLNFQDIEVRSVLQLIADFTDLNLVASDTVSGRITLRLKNVPWDQALELILKTKGLDKRQVGNVLLVAPAAEIAAREMLELKNQQQISELAPLRTEFIQVRYASAGELYKLFSASAGSKGGAPGGPSGATSSRGAIVSSRGSVIVDERTNAIILTDTADRLEEFRRVIAQLDIPVRQVLIESRIVTASTNYNQELGIRWGGGSIADYNGTTIRTGGSLNTLTELQNIIVDGTGSITSPDDLVVDLGAAAATSSFGIGFTGQDWLVDLELSALQVDGRAEVVARPKVITADKQMAVDRVGYRDSVSGSIEQRCDVGVVQERGAVARSDAADYAGRSDHHDVESDAGLRWRDLQRHPEYRHERSQDAGTRRQRADGRTGWHLQGRTDEGDRSDAIPRRPAIRRPFLPPYARQDRQERTADLHHAANHSGVADGALISAQGQT